MNMKGSCRFFRIFHRSQWCLHSESIAIGLPILGVLPQDVQDLAMGWVLKIKFLVS